jgi:hypothetical protein
MKLIQAALALVFFSFAIQSCCEPEYKDSFPKVLFDTYQDSAVFDRMPPAEGVTVFDSGYYPIYEFQVKNTGVDADTFTMTIEKDGFGFEMKKFVLGGETVTFRTPGPVPDTAYYPAQYLYFSFFRKDTNDLPIQELEPTLYFTYGAVYKGDEGCNTAASRSDIDTRLFR